MKVLYNLGIHLLVLGTLFRKRSRKNFVSRLGIGFPKIEKNGRPLVWIHAVSLGETKAIAPLIKKIKSQPDAPLILLSTVTTTGHEEGKRTIPEADWHVFLPFDLSYRIRRIVKDVSPNLVILTETDFWYHFQDAAKKQGANIVLINGKVSERSFHRFSYIPSFSQMLFDSLDLLCVQGKIYAERFSRLEVPTNKIVITGNIKLDAIDEALDDTLKEKLGIKSNNLVLTCGSTHDPEEKILLKALKKAWEKFPTLKVLLVPRHPERFDEVEKLLKQESLSYSRFSRDGNFSQSNIILVDAMGILKKCYRISDVAFVGGSFNPNVGGHNILEPAYYGVPVLFGPCMHSQPNFLDLMRAYRAGIQVNQETLLHHLLRLLEHPHKRYELGKNGRKLIHEAKGALEKTFGTLSPFLPKKKQEGIAENQRN